MPQTFRLCSVFLAFLLAGLGASSALAQPDDPTPTYDPAHYGDLEAEMIGPYRGGRVTAVTGVADKPHTYYMGSTGGGVWKTTNDGQDWHNISDGEFDVASIGGIDVAPSDPNVMYVGTGSACMRGNIQTGRGVYKSTDGGDSWSFIGLEDAGLIGDVVVHPDDPEVAYIAAVGQPFGDNEQRGVFRTTDGGDNWEKVLYISDSTGVVDLSMNPNNPREIYAGSWSAQRKPWTMVSGSEEGAIYKTTNGGEDWSELKGGLPQGLVGKTSVAVSPADPSRVWALVEAPQPEGGLYRSDDHGQSWTQVNDNRRHLQRSWYYTHLYADPQDENTVYSLNVEFLKSVDGGKSFESKGVPHGDVHDLWLNPDNPDRMVVGNDGGAQVTVDGADTWSTMYNQPTAEVYSVTVDDEFPYRVYGPQQDNSTIRLPSWSEGSIHPKSNWTEVGGCETGPVALHPDRPHLVYSGCYGGHLSRWNEETGQSRNVMVYPQLQLGQAPRTLRERFQWNAPIVVSPHDPDVVYHASNRIWRTTDGGMNWTRISGDLTTDTDAHQDYAGEPITRDNTGVEVFNTVFSLRVSPHSAETLWAGTDDGRVWLSRNEGGDWTEITPEAMPQYGTVQRIDVSPHDPGTAYLAVHRYRLDDWQPYIFRTTDYGESWTRIADGSRGIPSDSPVWVVREDPEREGLLYAGTEFGLHVSFNDGQTWQSLQQNLPVSRVPDLKVKDDDLVIATHGRSFWIMDDLAPLRQMTDQTADADLHLFDPAAAHLISASGEGDPENRDPEGVPSGASLDYLLAEAPDTTLTLDILNADGEVVQHFTSDSSAADAHDHPLLPAEAGHNRVSWNLRGDGVDVVDDAVVWGFTGGPKVAPGTYTARLATADGDTLRQPLDVQMDPRLEQVTQEDLQQQYALATEVRDTSNAIYDAVRTVRSVREQVTNVAEHAQEAGHETLIDRAETLSDSLSSIEQTLMQTKNESFQDPLNFPPQLDNQYAHLYGYVAGPDGPPTEQAYTRLNDLNQQWSEHRSQLQSLLNTEVAQFARRVRELDGGPVFIPTTLE
ncbi:MAG: WD40/YVTN/BNR-like repeat-containing protein [Salinivenus sp.]